MLPLTFLGWEFTCLVSAIRSTVETCLLFSLSRHHRQQLYSRGEPGRAAFLGDEGPPHSAVPSYKGRGQGPRTGLQPWGMHGLLGQRQTDKLLGFLLLRSEISSTTLVCSGSYNLARLLRGSRKKINSKLNLKAQRQSPS